MARYDRMMERIDPNQIYTVSFDPRNPRAPTYAHAAFGKRSARVGNYLTGDSVRRIAKQYGDSRYDQHYGLTVERVNTGGIGMDRIREIANANSKNLGKLYDQAMRDIGDMYKNSLDGDYGSEWYYENQPKGGFSGNSP